MIPDAVLLIVGLCGLLGGGEALVRGASSMARRLGISPLAIGLTVVAFGTSAPELAVNLTAAARGNGELSFGNIFGSNMANSGLVIAVAALLRPLAIHGSVVRREMPMMLLATAVAIVLGMDRIFGELPEGFGRGDAVILLLLFGVFLYYTVGDMLRHRNSEPLAGEADEELVPAGTPSTLASLGFTFVGLAGLIGGAQLTVYASVELARAFGVSEVVIGLTVVAIGTSLPELTAAVIATLRGHPDIAVGNVVGSNIFNILLVTGASAAVHPIPIPPGGYMDLLVTAVLSVILMGVSASQTRIIRWEAGVLLLGYLSYITWRALSPIPL